MVFKSSLNNHSGGGSGSVNSVTGLNTDNTDPTNPVVKISVDGVTITGAGTPASPLVSVGGGGGGDTITSPNSTITVGGTSSATTLDINLSNANTWAALQTFGNDISFGGATLAVSSLTLGNILQYNGTNWVNVTPASIGAGVTSFTGDGVLINNSASTGAVTATLATQAKNLVFAGPSSGSVATPTFRALVGADLPNPSASTLGGVESIAAVAHNFLTSISTSGVPTQAQPAFTDISGQATTAQLPTLTSGDIFVGNGSNVAAAVALSGDATLANTGVITLATVNANTGSFGSSTAIPNFTVNGKGLITAAGTSAVVAPAVTLTGTTLASNVVTSSLTTVGTIGTGIWQGTPIATAFIANSAVTYAKIQNEGAYTILGNNTGSAVAPAEITSLLLGTPGYTASGYNYAQWTATANSYAQISLQNSNSGSSASSDFVVTANDGNDTTHYADFGINNSAGGGAAFTNAHAVYVYTVDNELDIGALGVSATLNFYTTGGVATPVKAGFFDASQNLNLTNALAIGQGGTGQITKAAAFNALSPLTTSGDILYGGASGAGTRLAANSTATNEYLQSVSSGVPAWAQVAFSDLSGNATVAQGGTGQTTYTNGQLLIGNTTGNTLTKATLTGTTSQVIVTNSTGSITLSTPQNIDSTASPTFSGLTLSSFTQGSVLFAGVSGVVSQDNANLFYDDTNNRLGIGTTSPQVALDIEGTTAQINITANSGTAFVQGTGYAATGGNFLFRQARGSSASPTATQSGDGLCIVGGRGYGTTGFGSFNTARMRFLANQNYTDTAQGADIVFEATPVGSVTIAEVFRVSGAGGANITSPITTVNGSTSGTAKFSQSFQGATCKRVVIVLASLLGTASYTYPVAFVNTPVILTTSGLAASIITSHTTTAVTVTGATSTGVLILDAY